MTPLQTAWVTFSATASWVCQRRCSPSTLLTDLNLRGFLLIDEFLPGGCCRYCIDAQVMPTTDVAGIHAKARRPSGNGCFSSFHDRHHSNTPASAAQRRRFYRPQPPEPVISCRQHTARSHSMGSITHVLSPSVLSGFSHLCANISFFLLSENVDFQNRVFQPIFDSQACATQCFCFLGSIHNIAQIYHFTRIRDVSF